MAEAMRLREHQVIALDYMDANGSLLLAYGCGTGKTIIVLEWILRHIRAGDVSDVLVICPASLVGSWEQAISDVVLFEGRTEADAEALRRAVTIRSYQKTYKSEKDASGRRRIRLRDDVDRPWDALVCDESHCIGSHKSIQTKAAEALSRVSEHRFCLTGTPVHGGGGKEDFSKLYGQIQVVTGCRRFRNWTDFASRTVKSYDRYYKPREYDVPYCRALLRDHGIACRLEDCLDMPPVIECEVPCPISERKVYEDVRKGLVTQYGIDVPSSGSQYGKLLQICSGSVIAEDGTMSLSTSKDDALATILDGTDDAVVVFCVYKASLDRAMKVAKKCGRRAVLLSGDTPKDNWMRFRDGAADVIVVQYQAGSAGLNLQRSHTMVFFEPCRSSLLLEQAKARIHRQGQSSRCLYHYLITPNTIEAKVLSTVRSGADVSDAMLRDWAIGRA